MATEWETAEESASAEPAVREMNFAQYWAVIVKRRRLIGVCIILCLVAAVVVSLLSRPAYLAVAVLELKGAGTSPLEATATGQRGPASDSEFLPTQMRLMKGRPIAERVVRRLNLAEKAAPPHPNPGAATLDPVTRVALSIQRRVNAKPISDTSLVELSYVSSSAQSAAELANAFADAYVESTIDSRLQLAGETSAFLNTQIERLRSELAQKEQEVLAFRRQNDLVTTDAKTNVTMTNLDALNADYASAVRDRVAKEARYSELKNGRSDAIADSVADNSLQQLRAEQARLEREYSEKLGFFKPEWPAMVQLKAQIDQGQQQMNEAVSKARAAAQAEYQAAQRREENLKTELQSHKSSMINLNSNELLYSEHRLELQTKQAFLDSLLKRKAEADVMTRLGGERASYARIVERALPPSSAFKPSYRNNVLLGLFGGGLLGIGLAFFVSHLDRSLRTSRQVEETLQLPALGVIPSVGDESGWVYRFGQGARSQRARKGSGVGGAGEELELLPHRHPRSAMAECYRSFRTAFLLSQAGGVGSIVMTSALPKEGKTVTAVNLAVVLSQLGKKVLLVDADLHRSRLHEIFHISNRTGLVSILAEGVPPESAIAKTTIPDLFVLPSGPSSPNPSGLLSSEAMSMLLIWARRAYDHVILDTPPILPVADAMVLAHQTDGAVLCVRSGATPCEQVARTRDRMLRGGIRILGVLINGVEEDVAYNEAYADDEGPYGAHRPSPDKPAATS
ncbi:MAG: GumC family protein [Thermoanaerobaculia bacterium]